MQDSLQPPLTAVPSPLQSPRKSIFSQPWIRAVVLSVVVYVAVFAYEYVYFDADVIVAASESLSGAGGTLIGISFVLSSISFFFNFMDKELHYRKQYGLMGFFLALAYSFSLLFRFPDRYLMNFSEELTKPDVILGLLAMSIFGFMTIVSHPYGMKKLGRWWRPCLRLGYVAYLFLVIRAVQVEHVAWSNWLNGGVGLAPPRLILSIYALTIILLRIIMQFVIWSRARYIAKKEAL